MEKNKRQTMRYSDQELAIIKAVFAENDPLIFALRKIFLQVERNEQEVASLKFLNSESIKILRKTFLPEIDGDAPLFQLTDLYVQLGNEIKEKAIEDFPFYLEAKSLAIDYLEQQFTIIENTLPKTAIRLSDLATRNTTYVKLLARNYLLSHIEAQLNQFVFLAGLKTETVEETISRLQKNSNK